MMAALMANSGLEKPDQAAQTVRQHYASRRDEIRSLAEPEPEPEAAPTGDDWKWWEKAKRESVARLEREARERGDA